MAVKEKTKCTSCGQSFKETDFYKSFSPLYKCTERMSICKECVMKLYATFLDKYSDKKKAIYCLCQLLNVYYSETLYESALSQAEKNNNILASIYLQKVNSLTQYKNLTFFDSEKQKEDKSEKDRIKDIENSIKEIKDIETESEFELTSDIMDFFGKGFTKDEYEFLFKEYTNLINRFECDSYSQEMLFQEIAHQRLDIKNKRQDGQSVDKELKTLQDLLGSANIKPVQETGANSTEQATFGTLIKKWETEKPVPEPLDEWEKNDWIKKYVIVWFLGHLCKMMGVKNQFSDMYDEEIEQYTVDLDNEENSNTEAETTTDGEL